MSANRRLGIPVYLVAVYFMCFMAPFVVTVFFDLMFKAPVAILYLFPLLITLYLIQFKKIQLDNFQIFFLVAYFLSPFLLSLVGVFQGASTAPHGLNYSLLIGESIGRYFNLLSLLSFYLLVIAYFNKCDSYQSKFVFLKRFIWPYYIALMIVMAFGFLQLASFFGPSILFPFETRGNIHGVQDAATFSGITRLTSIAREPSFFAPLVIDAILISLFMISYNKFKLVASCCSVLLVLSFSGGGYLNIFVVILIVMASLLLRCLLIGKSHRKLFKYTAIFFTLIFLIFIALNQTGYLSIIADRAPTILRVENSTRAFMVFMPFVWSIESGVINFLFGHGVKSYALLGDVYTIISSGEPVHVTSNNLFSDVFWEHGLIGLLLIITFFSYVILKSVTPNVMQKEHWFALFITAHLIASSLYRADFVSPRFFILIIIINGLIYLGTEKDKRNFSVNLKR